MKGKDFEAYINDKNLRGLEKKSHYFEESPSVKYSQKVNKPDRAQLEREKYLKAKLEAQRRQKIQ